MRSEKFLKEKEIIIEYEKVYKDLFELSLLVKHSVWGLNEKQEKAYQENQIKKTELTTTLTSLEHPSEVTALKVKTLIWQLQSIIERLEPNRFNMKVLDSQGLMFTDSIFWFVTRDIEFAYTQFHNCVVTTDYIRTLNSEFDSSELIDYLNELKQLLISNPPKDYIELKELILVVFAHINEMGADYKRKHILTSGV